MPMLNNRLQLHNVTDAENLCHRILNNHLRRTRAHLRPYDHEDAIAYLLTTIWELSERYDPTRTTVSFSTYAYRLLTLRCVDWRRNQEGRTRWQFDSHTHERQRNDPLSLDHQTTGGHRLADTLTTPHGDPATDRLPDLTRILARPGSDEAWRPTPNNQRLPRRAA